MPIIAAKVKMDIEQAVFNALKKEFKDEIKDNEKGESSLKKQAKAISEIATVICTMLLSDVQVAPGIPVVGAGGGVPGPMSGSTTAPGKLL